MDVQRALQVEAPASEVDRVELRCFPSTDAVFVVRVRDLLAQLDPSELSPAVLESRARMIYPRVRVQVRDPLADLAPAQTTWYVYRDGRP